MHICTYYQELNSIPFVCLGLFEAAVLDGFESNLALALTDKSDAQLMHNPNRGLEG
jgi:hypothetical protein